MFFIITAGFLRFFSFKFKTCLVFCFLIFLSNYSFYCQFDVIFLVFLVSSIFFIFVVWLVESVHSTSFVIFSSYFLTLDFIFYYILCCISSVFLYFFCCNQVMICFSLCFYNYNSPGLFRYLFSEPKGTCSVIEEYRVPTAEINWVQALNCAYKKNSAVKLFRQ